MKLGGTVATMGFPDIGLPDFLNHETHELHENKKQIHSVSAFVCLVYFVVKIFSHAFGQGEITSLAGAADDPRYFQISLPVQPGATHRPGGALVDARGNVVGIVAAKLDASAALATTGSLPESLRTATK